MSCAQRARLCCGDPLELHGGFSIPLFRRRQLCSHLGVRIARFRLTRKGSCVCCSLAAARPGPPVPGSGGPSPPHGQLPRAEKVHWPPVPCRCWSGTQDAGSDKTRCPTLWGHAGGAFHPQYQLTCAFFLCGCGFGCHWGEGGIECSGPPQSDHLGLGWEPEKVLSRSCAWHARRWAVDNNRSSDAV